MNVTPSPLIISSPELSLAPAAMPADGDNIFADMMATLKPSVAIPDLAAETPGELAGPTDKPLAMAPSNSTAPVVLKGTSAQLVPLEAPNAAAETSDRQEDDKVALDRSTEPVEEQTALTNRASTGSGLQSSVELAPFVTSPAAAEIAVLPILQPATEPTETPRAVARREFESTKSDLMPIFIAQSVFVDQVPAEKPITEEPVQVEPDAIAPTPMPIFSDAKPTPQTAPIPPAQAVTEITPPKTPPAPDRLDIQITPLAETRAPVAQITRAEPAPLPLPFVDRSTPFAPQLMQITRDLLAVADDRNIRFNVRPDTLGPVAVSIERTDAGQNLRLGVENPAAVQAVRQAEPVLNDPRQPNPFVQVTVDLTAPDQQRSRTARAFVPARRNHDPIPEIRTEPAIPATGRYA